MKTLKQIKEENARSHVYYKYTCQHCGEEIILTGDELERVLFNPVEKEYEYWQGGFGPEFRHIGKHMVSTDPSKDYFQFECCNCHQNNQVSTKDYWDHNCDRDGNQRVTFELNDQQSQELRKWQKEQRVKRKGMRQDAMGMAYTYTITPGGLGSIIHVVDNYTHDELDLTHSEDW